MLQKKPEIRSMRGNHCATAGGRHVRNMGTYGGQASGSETGPGRRKQENGDLNFTSAKALNSDKNTNELGSGSSPERPGKSPVHLTACEAGERGSS